MLLDLDHCPVAQAIGIIAPFADHAIKCATAGGKPTKRRRTVGCRGRQQQIRPSRGDERFEPLATLKKRPFDQSHAIFAQQVEGDQHCRGFARQPRDAALGGMEPHLQRIEVEPLHSLDHQLAIKGEAVGYQSRNHRHHFGKIAPEWLPRFRHSATPSPSRTAMQRKPSHLGSNCQPASSGNSATRKASIGAGATVTSAISTPVHGRWFFPFRAPTGRPLPRSAVSRPPC